MAFAVRGVDRRWLPGSPGGRGDLKTDSLPGVHWHRQA
ncbi:hypothetical protein FHS39_000036 [Streptomyces olivoverticillatus]|uniref:Uncharacterized protein n=1 Tax=Streptomyces olivoverticillatus TaxID=66427 RepID=A0A7W7PHG4_9ACTN|nr:hypothetical protein [Streptomyces olivoverticillatus]